MKDDRQTYCLIASFGSQKEIKAAVKAFGAARIGKVTAYAPTPMISGRDSPVPIVSLVAGLAGTLGMFAAEVYANVLGYPLDIGGRPKFSWPSFVPIAFEVGVMLAVISIIVCVFITARLARLHAPVDELGLISRALSDRWVAVIETTDPETSSRARDLARSLHALETEELPDSEKGSHPASLADHGL